MMVHLGHDNCDSSWIILVPGQKRASGAELLKLAVEHFAVYCKDVVGGTGMDMSRFHLISTSDDYLVIK
jgi:hypothetical protein